MQFKDIPSNNITKQHLLKSIQNNRLSHAYMFLEVMALQTLLWRGHLLNTYCATPCPNRLMRQCPSCLNATTNHADFHWVFPVISGEYKPY